MTTNIEALALARRLLDGKTWFATIDDAIILARAVIEWEAELLAQLQMFGYAVRSQPSHTLRITQDVLRDGPTGSIERVDDFQSRDIIFKWRAAISESHD